MRFSLFVLLAAVAPACAKTIVVKVGQDANNRVANVFTPNAVKAAVGDVVRFEFRGGNHTVTQSSFAEPCTQQFNTVTKRKGVDSGFIPANNATRIGTFSIQVKQETSPIWMFCNRKPHCNNGMVFSINAPTDPTKNTMAKFIAKAKTAKHPGPGATAPFTPPAVPSASPSASAPGNVAPTPSPSDVPLGGGALKLGGSTAGILFTAGAVILGLVL